LPGGGRDATPDDKEPDSRDRNKERDVPIEIDRAGVQRLLAEGAQLVEVLPAADYEGEHLPGALNIPLQELDRKAVARFSRDAPVIVYCWDTR